MKILAADYQDMDSHERSVREDVRERGATLCDAMRAHESPAATTPWRPRARQPSTTDAATATTATLSVMGVAAGMQHTG